ncbi:hypothetical protein PGT21_011930 [Puccinia graminis f. sp. tritici]|uniref:Uncharacterized protein n=1 Tax=Puccinia graminis f. sp. tritici TaxID=56615 RepID=A0A5B0NE05_PUCGR|nr:hypothetical protein PGT21_011930 [Puccinia graminis f. sp. tritici]
MQRPGSHALLFGFLVIVLAAFTNAAFTQSANGHLLEPKTEPPELLALSCKNIPATTPSHPSELDHSSSQSTHSLFNLFSSAEIQKSGVKPCKGSPPLHHHQIQMHGSSSKLDVTTDLTMGNSIGKRPWKANRQLTSNFPQLVQPSGLQDDEIYPEEHVSFHTYRKNSTPSPVKPHLQEQQPFPDDISSLAYANGYHEPPLESRVNHHKVSERSNINKECSTQNLLGKLGKPGFNPSGVVNDHELPARTFIDFLGVGDSDKQRPYSSSHESIYKENQVPPNSPPDFHKGNFALWKSYGVSPLLDLSIDLNLGRISRIPDKTASSNKKIMDKEYLEYHISNFAFQKHEIPPNHFGQSMKPVAKLPTETKYAHGLRNSDYFQIWQSSHPLTGQVVDGKYKSNNAQVYPKGLKRKSPDLTEAGRDDTHQKTKAKKLLDFSSAPIAIKGIFGPFGKTKTSYINNKQVPQPQEPISKLVSHMKMTTSDHPEKYRNLNIYLYELKDTLKRTKLPRLTFKANSFKRKQSSEATKFYWESVLKLIKPEDKGRLIIKLSEFKFTASKFHRMSSYKVEKMSREEKYAFYTSKKRFFEDSKDTWFDYWALQTKLNFKAYCESRIPAEYRDVFPLFVFHVEMIRAIIPLPEEQSCEYTQKMAEACQFFEDLAKQKKENLDYLRKSKYGSGYLWDFLQPWIRHYSETLWTQMKDHNRDLSTAKGLINKLFSLSVENLTEQYRKRL